MEELEIFSEKQLREIADRLEMLQNCHINKKTKKIVFTLNQDDVYFDESFLTGEWKENADILEENRFDYYRINWLKSHDSYKIMEDFAMDLPEGKLQNELLDALDRRKPFRKFKDIVEFSDSREDWFKFKAKKQYAFVKNEVLAAEHYIKEQEKS